MMPILGRQRQRLLWLAVSCLVLLSTTTMTAASPPPKGGPPTVGASNHRPKRRKKRRRKTPIVAPVATTPEAWEKTFLLGDDGVDDTILPVEEPPAVAKKQSKKLRKKRKRKKRKVEMVVGAESDTHAPLQEQNVIDTMIQVVDDDPVVAPTSTSTTKRRKKRKVRRKRKGVAGEEEASPSVPENKPSTKTRRKKRKKVKVAMDGFLGRIGGSTTTTHATGVDNPPAMEQPETISETVASESDELNTIAATASTPESILMSDTAKDDAAAPLGTETDAEEPSLDSADPTEGGDTVAPVENVSVASVVLTEDAAPDDVCETESSSDDAVAPTTQQDEEDQATDYAAVDSSQTCSDEEANEIDEEAASPSLGPLLSDATDPAPDGEDESPQDNDTTTTGDEEEEASEDDNVDSDHNSSTEASSTLELRADVGEVVSEQESSSVSSADADRGTLTIDEKEAVSDAEESSPKEASANEDESSDDEAGNESDAQDEEDDSSSDGECNSDEEEKAEMSESSEEESQAGTVAAEEKTGTSEEVESTITPGTNLDGTDEGEDVSSDGGEESVESDTESDEETIDVQTGSEVEPEECTKSDIVVPNAETISADENIPISVNVRSEVTSTVQEPPVKHKSDETTAVDQSREISGRTGISDNDILVSAVTWNLAEESPAEKEANFIKRFRKGCGSLGRGSDLVLFSGQECENIKPRRTEGRRSREFRRLMITMLGKDYVPLALHLLGGIQFGLFCRRDLLDEIEQAFVADVTCGVGNVFHNKGAIGCFVQMKARSGEGLDHPEKRSKKVRLLFVAAHMNSVARDSDFWRIMGELEGQAPARFLPPSKSESVPGKRLLEHADKIFFCGDLNYRIDLPREEVESYVMRMKASSQPKVRTELRDTLLRHDQLRESMALERAFPRFSEGDIVFPPTFKFDKGTDDYDTSQKQRVPAWTDRILFKGDGIQALEYDAVLTAQHSDHRPVIATFQVEMLGKLLLRGRKRRKT